MKKVYEQTGIYIAPSADILNLAMNENHNISWKELYEKNMGKLVDQFNFSAYGQANFDMLTAAYGKHIGMDKNQIIVFPGSESAIGLLFSALVEKKVLLMTPDFFRFEEVATQQGLTIFKQDLLPAYDYTKTIALVEEQGIELGIFSTPNNPLGTKITSSDIIELLEKTNCYWVIDEAYIEFSGDSVLTLIAQYDKLFIMRTLSKAWGLAALRVGFVISQPENITYLTRAVGPYNHSRFIATMAVEALGSPHIMNDALTEITRLRKIWQEKLTCKYAFKMLISQTNFFYIQTSDAPKLQTFFHEKGIAIALVGPSALRITIGTEVEMQHVEKTFDAYYELK
ncbi:histidinol-phosphate aminotransferase [Erysipelotrichaceae bacterium]|nr:histidinol-phosphate aminotransferase [Erysipelotrichaceae bacterium]